jgi:hypothetical protein
LGIWNPWWIQNPLEIEIHSGFRTLGNLKFNVDSEPLGIWNPMWIQNPWELEIQRGFWTLGNLKSSVNPEPLGTWNPAWIQNPWELEIQRGFRTLGNLKSNVDSEPLGTWNPTWIQNPWELKTQCGFWALGNLKSRVDSEPLVQMFTKSTLKLLSLEIKRRKHCYLSGTEICVSSCRHYSIYISILGSPKIHNRSEEHAGSSKLQLTCQYSAPSSHVYFVYG